MLLALEQVHPKHFAHVVCLAFDNCFLLFLALVVFTMVVVLNDRHVSDVVWVLIVINYEVFWSIYIHESNSRDRLCYEID